MRQVIPVVVFVGVALSSSASGQSPGDRPPAPDTATSRPAWKAARANPYGRLFPATPQRAPSQARRSSIGPDGTPIVKCGMTLVPGDASIDPGIAAPPADRATRFTVRGVEPPICR